MRLKKIAVFTVTTFTSLAALAGSTPPIDFHGYLRSGTGSADEGGKQACFKLQGAASKYRLGNECETWLEIDLGAEVAKIDNTAFAVHTMIAYEGPQNTGDERNTDILRQAWGEAKNLGPGAFSTASAWAGKRFYKRMGPHLNDYNYLENDGMGGGIENISVGPGKLSYAYIRESDPTDASVSQTNHDFRYEGVPVNPNGSLDFVVIVGNKNIADNKNNPANVNKQYQNGLLLHVQHNQQRIFGHEGKNSVVLQYGDKNMDLTFGSSPGTYDGKQWRLLDHFFLDLSSQLQAEGVISYTDADSSSASKNAGTPNGRSWFSAGIRPVYSFSRLYSLAVELGYDQIDNEYAPSGKNKKTNLTKLTIAPQLGAGTGYWARPVLRAFATFASWNEKGAVLPDDVRYANQTSGWSYGVQAEAWW